MKAIILAAGEGTRMRPLTLKTPKPLLKIHGRPILGHIFDALPNEIDEVIVVVKYLRDQIKSYLGNKCRGRRVGYVMGSYKGTAYSLIAAKKFLDKNERFLFLYGDELPNTVDIKNSIKYKSSILVFKSKNPETGGVVAIDKNKNIIEIEEKPQKPKSKMVAVGVMVLNENIFNYKPSLDDKEEFFLTPMLSQYVKENKTKAIFSKNFIGDITLPSDIKRAERLLKRTKTAVITGGSRGIGKEVAKKLLQEGFRVIILGREEKILKEAKLELERYGETDFLSVDVSNHKQVKKAVKEIVTQFLYIDVLINVAGVHGSIGFLPDVKIEEWQEAIKVNLFGTVNMIHTVLPEMIKEKHGKIINFSGGGASSPRPFFSAYAASKSGIVNFTENIASELADKRFNIDINVVAPGAINTRLLDEIIEVGPGCVGKEEYKKIVTQKKTGGNSLNNITELCLFLASEGSDGISGKFFSAIWDNQHNILKYKKEIMSSDIYNLRRIKPKERGYEW